MTIDRSIQPPIRPVEKPALISPRKVLLRNGLPVYQLMAGTQDVCKIDFLFGAGTWQQLVPLQAGLANAMLQEGSENYRADEIAGKFDFHGAYLQLSADQHYGIVTIVSLTRHLPRILPVVEDLIKRSVFPVKEFETLVSRRKQRFFLENEKVKVLCQKKFSEALFGEGHPYAQTVKEEDFDLLRLDDLVCFYRSWYHSGNCEILVSGRFDETVTNMLDEHFGGDDWLNSTVEPEVCGPKPSSEKNLFVPKPGAIQSAIRVGRIMVKKNHPDYIPLQVLVTILGGYFSSRLMMNIREQKGYTYGVGAHLVCFREDGYLVIATEVDKSYEQLTLKEIFYELRRLREELVSQEELDRVQQYLLGEFLRDLDGPFALSQAFLNVHEYGLDYSFYEKYFQSLLTISATQLKQTAEKYFREESFYTVVAGREAV
ncbi:MAG: pitrilysin family protein [Prolixibacteraceae bacterium]